MNNNLRTIRVRFQGGTHQAIDDRSWQKCTCTSGHREAAKRLLEKQGITGVDPVRWKEKEEALHDPAQPPWRQWQVFVVKA